MSERMTALAIASLRAAEARAALDRLRAQRDRLDADIAVASRAMIDAQQCLDALRGDPATEETWWLESTCST